MRKSLRESRKKQKNINIHPSFMYRIDCTRTFWNPMTLLLPTLKDQSQLSSSPDLNLHLTLKNLVYPLRKLTFAASHPCLIKWSSIVLSFLSDRAYIWNSDKTNTTSLHRRLWKERSFFCHQSMLRNKRIVSRTECKNSQGSLRTHLMIT